MSHNNECNENICPNVEVCRILTLTDANRSGFLHGGVNLKLTEEAGYIAVTRYLNSMHSEACFPILCRIENTDFIQPAKIGDLVIAKAKVIFTSAYSIAVNAKVFTENLKHPLKLISSSLLWYANGKVDKEKRVIKYFEVPDFPEKNEEYESSREIFSKNSHFEGRFTTPFINEDLIPKECLDLLTSYDFESYHIISPDECTHFGTVLGGSLLRHMDNFTAVSAAKHCRSGIVTVRVDSFDFYIPLFQEDICVFCPKVIFTSPRSIEIKINVFLNGITDLKHLVCSAFFTFVALDSNFKCIDVPQLSPQTAEEINLFEKRRKLYEEKKKLRSQKQN